MGQNIHGPAILEPQLVTEIAVDSHAVSVLKIEQHTLKYNLHLQELISITHYR